MLILNDTILYFLEKLLCQKRGGPKISSSDVSISYGYIVSIKKSRNLKKLGMIFNLQTTTTTTTTSTEQPTKSCENIESLIPDEYVKKQFQGMLEGFYKFIMDYQIFTSFNSKQIIVKFQRYKMF